MDPLRILNASEQVAARLREELRLGTWTGVMPGGDRLTAELGVGRDTVEAALSLLEEEGLLLNQGPRRRRRIVGRGRDRKPTPMRVAILLGEASDRRLHYLVELRHQLSAAGCHAFFARRTLAEMERQLPRIRRLVAASGADAWVVVAGSRELLEWFAASSRPVFALFGRIENLPIAGAKPDKPSSYTALTRRLVELGHRRVVLLARSDRRLPAPGRSERAFFAELRARGIPTGSYNLPDWEESVSGFHRLLDTLFDVTPPTALIADGSALFHAARDHLARAGLIPPDHYSLACSEADPGFAWCRPTVAHIRWDPRPIIRRVVRWVENLARGRTDLRQTLTESEFVEGGTIGPVPSEASPTGRRDIRTAGR